MGYRETENYQIKGDVICNLFDYAMEGIFAHFLFLCAVHDVRWMFLNLRRHEFTAFLAHFVCVFVIISRLFMFDPCISVLIEMSDCDSICLFACFVIFVMNFYYYYNLLL